MIHPEHAKLIPVTGTNDQPDMANAVEVQFNPATLRVSLSNTLRANPRSGGSRSAQYVDKSSSTLAVELIFDTTYIDTEAEQIYQRRAQEQGRGLEAVQAGSDVRLLTKRIAERFIQPVGSGEQMQAPKRCLFQWGAFEFIGLVQSFDETLDFFSPEGRPLRATVTLRLSEDRFQFRNRDVAQAERQTPTLTTTGAQGAAGTAPAGDTLQSMPNQPGHWQDVALYNGVENPRSPVAGSLAIPSFSARSSLSGGLGAGVNLSARITAPAFKFGASASLGTSIEGAFNVSGAATGLTAGAIIRGGSPSGTTGDKRTTVTGLKNGIKTGVGFD
jgi:hypothetical protein